MIPPIHQQGRLISISSQHSERLVTYLQASEVNARRELGRLLKDRPHSDSIARIDVVKDKTLSALFPFKANNFADGIQ
jgi:hypothetical protein